jgi:hypothetical protein
MGRSAKIILVVGFAFASAAFAQERICAPVFETVGLHTDFAVSSVRVLAGKMEAAGENRVLIYAPPGDSVSAASPQDKQLAWAKERQCAYLLQGTLTRLGETVQVNTRLLRLDGNEYVFKRAYQALTPDDLNPVMGQVSNNLLDPQFKAVESIYDVSASDTKALAKKKSSSYWGFGVGYSWSNPVQLVKFDVGYLWDNRWFMGEILGGYGLSIGDSDLETGTFILGLRFLYPFSDGDHSFYAGGGLGFGSYSQHTYRDSPLGAGDDYDYSNTEMGLNIEAVGGFMVGRTSTFRLRTEAMANLFTAKIHKKTQDGSKHLPVGIGLRMVLEYK